MKEIVKAILILAVIYLLLFFLVKTNRQSQVIQDKQSQPVVITDTLTNVLYDTVFVEHFETVKLPVDTLILINDSIRVDSVFVEVPISIFKFDTCFTTDSTNLNIRLQNSGYAVTLDSLSYYFEYAPRLQKKTNFLKEHFKFGVGAGLGYGCFTRKPDIFLGFGFYYCF